ncbi:hypothetical protein NFI96_008558, partial [Prochilodus magdalenae]
MDNTHKKLFTDIYLAVDFHRLSRDQPEKQPNTNNRPDGNPNRSHFAYENSNPDYENQVMFVLLECESTEDSVSFSQYVVFLFWSAGPACCSDVVGYSGGSVLVFSDLQWDVNHIRYVCKVERSGCINIMKDQTNNNMVNVGRFKMYANANDEFLLLIRELNPQDSGVYRFGVGTESHKDLELTVQTGPACCSDVVGYSGGSVLVFSDLQWGVNHIRYVCKVERSGCTYIMKDQTNRNEVILGRFEMYSNVDDEFLLLIRELNPWDSGVYRFGVGTESHKDVELTVQTDSCCGRIEKMNAYLGVTATFTCNYPDAFKTNNKHLINLRDQSTFNDIIYTKKDSQVEQEDRYSIFDDSRAKVFRVNISGVREDDGGVYLCGVWKNDKSVGYYSYFKEIHLRVTDSSLIISVCVCGALLLIGGAALIIYKLRNHMRQDSVETSQRTAKHNIDEDDDENVPHGNRYNLNMGPIHNRPDANPKRSDLAKAILDPGSTNSIHFTLHFITGITRFNLSSSPQVISEACRDSPVQHCKSSGCSTFSQHLMSDSCCGRIEKMNAYLGEMATFTCNYPDELKTNNKYLDNLSNQNRVKEIINTGKDSQIKQKDRYSIFDDRRFKVFNVNISGVREDDGGVYLCGVWRKEKSVGYYSYFKEIQLQVPAPGPSVIITSSVCIGMALVLIGGSALITRYLKYKERQGSSSNTDHEDNEQANAMLDPGSTNSFQITLHRVPGITLFNLPSVPQVIVEAFRGIPVQHCNSSQCYVCDPIAQMLILWISTLYLISVMFLLLECESTEESVSFSQCEVFLFWSTGPACCSDVVGYSGGSVLVFSDLQWDVNHIRYVCKVEQSGCTNIMKDQMNRNEVNAGRFMMYSNMHEKFVLLIRELNPQDSAVYRFGVGTERHNDVELTVQTDSCCGRIEKINAYLGETATFTCNYPDEFKTSSKYLDNFNNQTIVKEIMYTEKDSQMEQEHRYSIFDDRRSKVFSVNISGVREDDGGVYLCGVWREDKSVGYYSYFKEIQLQVTDRSCSADQSGHVCVNSDLKRNTEKEELDTISGHPQDHHRAVMFVLLECESIEDSVSFSQCEVFLFWSTGPVCCSNVVGYSGGSVLVFSNLQWDVNHIRYVCKVEESGCTNIIKDQTNSTEVNAGRFKMYANVDGNFTMLIRELNPQDSAVYRFGVGTESHKDVVLTVQTDSCCGRIEKMDAYLGETATFTCNYPDELRTNNKYLTNLNNQTTVKEIMYTEKDSQMEQKHRYSIFDDRRSKVFSVNISGVREDDGGVYLCGVWRKDMSVGYYSYFKEIQLQVTAPGSSSSIIITVGVCVTLLLIGGLAVITYCVKRKKRQGSSSSTDNRQQAVQLQVLHISALSALRFLLWSVNEEINYIRDALTSCTDASDKDIHSTQQLPKHPEPTYTTTNAIMDPGSTNSIHFTLHFVTGITLFILSTAPQVISEAYSGIPVQHRNSSGCSTLSQHLMSVMFVLLECESTEDSVSFSQCEVFLFWSAGPVYCSDVVVYSGGSVTVLPDGNFTMLIRELNPQDSAVYRFDVGTERHKDVELTVQTDSCCGRIEKMNGYLGETATFTCNYPDEFKTNYKYLYNFNNQTTVKEIINTGKDSQVEQKDRYSISDDRGSKVFSVKISGVREDDGGVYLCGVWRKDKSVGYYSFFKEIQANAILDSGSTNSIQFTLHFVTGITLFSLSSVPQVIVEAYSGIPVQNRNSSGCSTLSQHLMSGSSIIISVCVCGALLLIGGAALIIYKLRNHMRQDSVETGQRTAKQNTDDDKDDYENAPHGNQYNLNMGPIHNRPVANPYKSDLVYENFDSNTNQSDSKYEKIVVDPNQSDSEYEKI